MKINFPKFQAVRASLAMSIAEMMVSLAIFTLLFGGLIASQMFGLRQDELTSSKMGANDQARTSFNMILDEIRSSKDIQIGSGDYSNFIAITNGPQQGNSMQIIASYNLRMYIYYWFDTNLCTLWRAGVSNGVLLQTNLITQYLTNSTSQWISNSMIFRAMDFTGTTNLTVDPTNYNTYNYVINVLMQFTQYQYPLTKVGSNYLYNYYQLTYSATRRNP